MITRYILEQVSKVGTSKKHNAPWDCQDGLPRNGRRGALKGVFLDVNGAAIRPGSPMKCMGTVICPTASPLASSLRRPLFIPRPLSAPHRTEPDPERRSATFSGKGPQQALELLHVIADSTGAHPGTRERRPETNLHGLLHAMRYTPSVTHMESQVSRRDRTNSMLQHGAKTASTTHHLRSVSRRRTPRRRSSVLVRHVLSVRFGPLRRRPAHQLQLRHPSRSMKVKVSL